MTNSSVSKPRPIDAAEHVKNPAAVALGRRGGSAGGKARAAALSKVDRVAIARRAAKARWERRKVDRLLVPLWDAADEAVARGDLVRAAQLAGEAEKVVIDWGVLGFDETPITASGRLLASALSLKADFEEAARLLRIFHPRCSPGTLCDVCSLLAKLEGGR